MADPVLVEMVQESGVALLQPLPPQASRGDLVDDIGELDKFSAGRSDIGRDIDGNINVAKSISDIAQPPYLLRKYGIVGYEYDDDEIQCSKRRKKIGKGLILGHHEMRVCETHVDERIAPGFKYRVRIVSEKRQDRFQFGGKALYLTRIGQGYGKRLTFEGESLNDNPNYFWSDTLPNGYAFIISAVRPGDEFVLCQENRRPFGHATVVAADQDQIELSSAVEDGKSVVKRVLVSMCISVHYTCEPHGMMSLRASEIVEVMGVAVVRRGPGSRSRAMTRCIEEVQIPGHGECLLYREED